MYSADPRSAPNFSCLEMVLLCSGVAIIKTASPCFSPALTYAPTLLAHAPGSAS